MDKIEEIKKLKQLFDDGVITNEEFLIQKQKILGITLDEKTSNASTEQNNKNNSNLDEYENELLKQINEEKQKNIDKNDEENENFYEREKLKEKAKLEAQEEIREKRTTKRNKMIKDNINSAKNKMTKILKWILAVCCWLITLGSFSAISQSVLNIPIGIIFMVLGILACPTITEFTTKYAIYTRNKKWIVIVLIIIAIILMNSMY